MSGRAKHREVAAALRTPVAPEGGLFSRYITPSRMTGLTGSNGRALGFRGSERRGFD